MSFAEGPYLGAAYYPEDWSPEIVDEDIRLMKDLGINCVRIAEFAWSSMEPQEGQYEFGWLQDVVEKCYEANIAVVMCTPTCTPPAWLTERYPECLLVMENNRPMQHGSRRQFCPNQQVYRDHCARIVVRMAKEFGKHPGIIGWQIDNELYPMGTRHPDEKSEGARGCCCPACYRKFLDTLRERYGSIQALNEAWGTHLWSQTYQSFAQIPIPRSMQWHHPSLVTAWCAFQGDSLIDYAAFQADILRKHTEAPIGTDMMPFNGVHYRKMNEHMDVVQYNHYDSMEGLRWQIFWMDYLRNLKERPFWVTETSTCWSGNVVSHGYKEPGFCTINSWLPMALGGEANMYWLWRCHWSGQELLHGSVVSSAGRPMHTEHEVRALAKGYQASASFLKASKPVRTGLAVHYSSYAWWLYEFQPMVHGFKYLHSLQERCYLPMVDVQLRPDVIDPAADLAPYKLLFSPFLPCIEEEGLHERILDWVNSGGIWVVGPMSDIRTMDATKYKQAPLGFLEEWAGIYTKYQVPGDPRDFALQWEDNRESQGGIWYDGFECSNAKALATYTDGPLKGLAAYTRTNVGKGAIILLGTMPAREDLQTLMLNLAEEAGLPAPVNASSNLLVVPREGAQSGLVCIELQNKHATLHIDAPCTDLLTGKSYESGTIEVDPCGVLVLEE